METDAKPYCQENRNRSGGHSLSKLHRGKWKDFHLSVGRPPLSSTAIHRESSFSQIELYSRTLNIGLKALSFGCLDQVSMTVFEDEQAFYRMLCCRISAPQSSLQKHNTGVSSFLTPRYAAPLVFEGSEPLNDCSALRWRQLSTP